MSNLKTLKDFTTKGLEFREKRASEKLIEDLKQLGIEWIKHLNKLLEKMGQEDGGYGYSIYSKEQQFMIKLAEAGKIEWIKHFFNISDSELKNA